MIGLRLSGSIADVATLGSLVDAFPEIVESVWTSIADPMSSRSTVSSHDFDEGRASVLMARGLDVVRVFPKSPGVFDIDPIRGGPTERWSATERSSATLAEAVRPIPVEGEPPAAEGLFVMDATKDAPRKLIERLLLLGRDDAQVLDLVENDRRLFCVSMSSPPLYTLMRARDHRDEATTAYTSRTPDVWVEWGYIHPLERVIAAGASRSKRTVLIDRSGVWRIADPKASKRSIYDALEPRLDGRRVDLIPSREESRFVVRLRLASGPEHDPDLWLLDADRFFQLEHFLMDASPEEVRPFTVSRLEREGRPLYLLRERVQPGTTRVGARISEVVRSPGYSKNLGTENLYLPVGRRIVPKVRRDDLRLMLDLDRAAAVIILEGRDGIEVMTARDLDEAPLSSWLEYVATDRRLELDRLIERTVFSFPPMDVERAEKSTKAPAAVRPPNPEPKVSGSRPRRPAETKEKRAEFTSSDDLAEIRGRAREIEERIALGGCEDPTVFLLLADLEARLGSPDEAASCLEGYLFHSGQTKDLEAIRRLEELRAQMIGGPSVDLFDLAAKAIHSPSEASLLAARLLGAIARRERSIDDTMQVAGKLFSDPGTPSSRRVAWLVLSTWCRSTGDTLGMTRAREAILGGINERGLSEIYDLPRFVRYALALEDDDSGTNVARARAEQLGALERLLAVHFRELPELDSMSAFVRVIAGVGLMRLGAASRAKGFVQSVERELPAHDRPNQVLYRAYMARMAFEGTDGERAAWLEELSQILAAADKDARRVASWFAKRSVWLGEPADTGSPSLRVLVDRLLLSAAEKKQDLGDTLTKLARDKVYRLADWEIVVVIERTMAIALGTGVDALVEEVLSAAMEELSTIQILGHRIRAVAACLRGAATLEDHGRVNGLLDRIVEITRSKDVPWVNELLLAVRPCLSILRRLGADAEAKNLLDHLEPVATKSKLDASLLASAIADGHMMLGRAEKADELIELSLGHVFDPALDYVARFESAALAIDVLRHWPSEARAAYYHRFLRALDHFRDTFTTSQYFPTHKVLVVERIVDALADAETRQSDKVQGFLDTEEHGIRTKIIADWKELCGR